MAIANITSTTVTKLVLPSSVYFLCVNIKYIFKVMVRITKISHVFQKTKYSVKKIYNFFIMVWLVGKEG